MMIEIPKIGRVGTLISSSVKNIFESFTGQISDSENLMIITRLSPRRLIRHIDLNSIDFRWLSIEDSVHSIDPSLEHVNHLVNSKILENEGIIWIDGLEYLADRQGFDAVHSFVRNIVDSVGNTKWKIIIAIEIGTFNEIEIAQIIRESSELNIQAEIINTDEEIIENENEDISNKEDLEIKKIKVTGLKLLTKISREGFTQNTLRERIMQWRDMGLDVSILEPALKFQNQEDAYELYLEVEELVRMAVELDTRLDILKERGETAKVFAYKYRIRQLTGLDEISRIVDTLLS